MPAGDRTGPQGQGPLTGRGMGDCKPPYQKVDSPTEGGTSSTPPPAPRPGYGSGMGRGRGFGRGRGPGRGRW